VTSFLVGLAILALVLVPAAILPMVGPWASGPNSGLAIFAWWALLLGGGYWWHTHRK